MVRETVRIGANKRTRFTRGRLAGVFACFPTLLPYIDVQLGLVLFEPRGVYVVGDDQEHLMGSLVECRHIHILPADVRASDVHIFGTDSRFATALQGRCPETG